VVSFTPQPLYPRGKSPRWLGGPRNQSGWRGGKRNLVGMGARTPTPRPPSPYPVPIPAELSRLLKHFRTHVLSGHNTHPSIFCIYFCDTIYRGAIFLKENSEPLEEEVECAGNWVMGSRGGWGTFTRWKQITTFPWNKEQAKSSSFNHIHNSPPLHVAPYAALIIWLSRNGNQMFLLSFLKQFRGSVAHFGWIMK
jgi:hypothetical protein